MNTKIFSGILLFSVISISACQAEKVEKSEVTVNSQRSEKRLLFRRKRKNM